MALYPYTKKSLVERVQLHMSNNFPSSDSRLTDAQVSLYIDQAAAFTVVGQVYNAAKIEGNLVTPEAWLTTYLITDIQQNSATGDWYVTLPQPPVSLPLGYSITNAYFAQTSYGKSQPIFFISAKRVPYRNFMPKPTGVSAWVEGETMWLSANNGQPLLNQKLYVQMIRTRTQSLDEPLLLPDDSIELIFNNVIAKCKDRLQLPQDTLLDGLPAGNKTS